MKGNFSLVRISRYDLFTMDLSNKTITITSLDKYEYNKYSRVKCSNCLGLARFGNKCVITGNKVPFYHSEEPLSCPLDKLDDETNLLIIPDNGYVKSGFQFSLFLVSIIKKSEKRVSI